MPATSLALFMQQQRAAYAEGLPAKIAALQAAVGELGEHDNPSALDTARAQAHKLAGSGGTFGFPAVSRAAARIESILSRSRDARVPPQAESNALQLCLRALEAALASDGGAEDASSDLAVAAAARTVAGAGTSPPSSASGTSPLVCVLEPDDAMAQALVRQLSLGGYRCFLLGQPLAAALAPPPEPPAAVVANVGLSPPVLSALRGMTQTWAEAGTEVPVIFMSGGTDFQTRLQAVQAGGAGYFPAPVDVSALTALLDHLTSGEPARPYRVLLVDDDQALAELYAGVLESAGLETLVVTDPRQVMASLVDFQPDLLTCDIHMPQCSGIELAALIRQQAQFVRLPIVFLSAETSLSRQALALKQGGDDFIIKPVAPAVLISVAQSRARRYRSLVAAEDTLRISEERLRMVFETSLDGFIQALADGTVVSANPSACALFRMTEAQIKAAGVNGLFDRAGPLLGHPADKFRGELDCLRADGSRFPAEVSSSQHLSSEGDVQVSVVLRDITERQLAEQQILQLNTELEARVEQRTAELREANQELQAFSHSLAHDLRQPYIAISGLTHLLERELSGGTSERGKHYLARIRAGVGQMNERTDSLLALAQLSRTQTRREVVDLSAMASELLHTLAQQEPERTVSVRVQQPLQVQADAALLRHLLHILIGNAWKFTSRQATAEITVGAEFHLVEGSARETVFFVKDNGAGFDMAYADKLFGAFQRLHAPAEFAGAGVGLATARRIVTRHAGRIWATSSPGEGAVFYFTLDKPVLDISGPP
ncbi:MAG: response regulator [Polaromonas sp.]|nr:response regulator [Polaromonas sp.]MDP3752706.1 response regulator [Polaromonas sp.]